MSGFIDLHSHTNESDGTLTPPELLSLASSIGLKALAITDHDTFDGYEMAEPLAKQHGLELVQGIELNSRFYFNGETNPRYIHVLAYFPVSKPNEGFYTWLTQAQDERLSRNRKLAQALQARGVQITFEEVEKRGRSLAGRPHFARILVEKGYAKNIEDAFNRYLGENAPTYVQRESHTTEETIQIVREGGGIPVVAHPIRTNLTAQQERPVFAHLKDAGLLGLEIYHSEHSPQLQDHYRHLAMDLDLLPTGGSDFHGPAVKPDIDLGTGRANNVHVPFQFLEDLRACVL